MWGDGESGMAILAVKVKVVESSIVVVDLENELNGIVAPLNSLDNVVVVLRTDPRVSR